MYKILIVEDEKLELDALWEILSDQCPGVGEIRGCGDGESALELLENYTPNIIFMDIHLGGTDGLSLAGQIRKILPDTRIIMITAFDQFSYAQQAIKIGAADYLLKPVSTAGLLAALQKQTDFLDGQRQDLRDRVRQQAQFSKLQSSFSSSLISSVIHNSMTPHTGEIMKLFGLCPASMQLYILELDLEEYQFSESETAALKKLIVDSLKDVAELTGFLYDFMSSREIVLCALDDENQTTDHTRRISLIRQTISDDFHIPFRIGISAPTNDPGLLPLEYKRALSALQLSDAPLCSYYEIFPEKETPFQIHEITDGLTCALMDTKEDELLRQLSRLQETAAKSFRDFSEAKAAYIALWVEIMQEIKARFSLQSQTFSELLVNPITDFIDTNNLSALHDHCKNHLFHALEKIRRLTEEKKNYAALRAQSYIEIHYAESLTLQSIADALHISPYYLCHIFKCSLDTSVMDYLNTCRIRAAREMLRAESMSVKDIALAVGFSDPNYFCRVFKRVTGVTPSVYKRMEE